MKHNQGQDIWTISSWKKTLTWSICGGSYLLSQHWGAMERGYCKLKASIHYSKALFQYIQNEQYKLNLH